MTSSNEKLTRQIHDYFSANQFDHCVEMAEPTIKVVAHALGMTFHGQEEFRQFMMGFKQAFPDLVIHHDNIFSNGNQVAIQFTATGTHTGPLQTPAGPIPASGRKVVLKVAEIMEWKDGKLTQINNYQDSGSLMKQIGALG